MAARPRKVTDDEIFTAVHRVIGRRGPARVTLAEIAEEAGVTASALVQRFGSKRDLLLAFTALGPDATRDLFARLRAESDSPLGAVRAYAECMAGMAETPEALAHHLGYLQLDLGDPEFRSHVGEQARVTDEEMTALLREAVAADELHGGTDPARLSRAVQAVVTGSLFSWAFRPQGTTAAHMRENLDAVLAPHATRSRATRKRAPPAARGPDR